MIQLILKAASLFCGLGGPYIAPLILPIYLLLNPLIISWFVSCWGVLLISIFTPIMTSDPNILNSKDGEKRGGRAFGFAFLIYYVVVVISMCIVMQKACQVNDQMNPF